MEVRVVDVLVEVARYHEVHRQQRYPQQDHAHEPVHRNADQPLDQLAEAVDDGADDDGGEREIHRAGDDDGVGAAIDEYQLAQLSGRQHVDHEEPDDQDRHADEEVKDRRHRAPENRVDVDGSDLDREVHGCLLWVLRYLAPRGPPGLPPELPYGDPGVNPGPRW